MNPAWAQSRWLWQPAALALVLAAVEVVPVLATLAVLALAAVALRWGPTPALVLGLLATVCLHTDARPAGILLAAGAVMAAGLDRREAALLAIPGVTALAGVITERGPTARLVALGVAVALAAGVLAVRETPSSRLEGPRLVWLLPAMALVVVPQLVPGEISDLLDVYGDGVLLAVAAGSLAAAAVLLAGQLPAASGRMDGPPDPGGT